jgi:hypothetical protein
MSEQMTQTYADFLLPPSLVTRVDISRLVHEAERVDNEMTSASVRAKAGASQVAVPVMSDQLQEFLTQNQLSLDNSIVRTDIIKQLRLLKDKVPVVHMTFAVTADRESLEYLAGWLRSSVHRQAVISVGLQPALVAGVYLRTPNRVMDLSMRALLQNSHDKLTAQLGAFRG